MRPKAGSTRMPCAGVKFVPAGISAVFVGDAGRIRRAGHDGFFWECVISLSRPQPGDTPISCGLWLEGGIYRHVPFSLYDSKTAIFQRFAIFILSRSAFGSAPTERYARFLEVVVGKGCVPLCFASFVRHGNGGIPTICDFEVVVARMRFGPNRGDMSVSCRLGLRKGSALRVFTNVRRDCSWSVAQKSAHYIETAVSVLASPVRDLGRFLPKSSPWHQHLAHDLRGLCFSSLASVGSVRPVPQIHPAIASERPIVLDCPSLSSGQ